jgi:flagellar basal-body rod protein FlgG
VRNFTQGNLNQTGNSLDVAVNGNGFLQVQQPDGTTAYTRDGSLQIDANGQLVTANGAHLTPAITLPPGAKSITIGSDGTVSAIVSGQAAPQQVGQLQLASFPNPAGLQAIGQNLYTETVSSGTPTAGTPGNNGLGVLSQGYVETSNVNVVEELVNMIQTKRAFEINSKAVQTSDQMLARLAQL